MIMHTAPSGKRTQLITANTYDTSHFSGSGSTLTIRRIDYFDGFSFVKWITKHGADSATGLAGEINDFIAYILEHIGGLKPDGSPFEFVKNSYTKPDGTTDYYFSKW